MKKFIFLSALLLSAINLHCQTVNSYKNISLAEKNYKNENYDKAILFSMRCLTEEPNNILALVYIQLSNHFLGRYEISNEYGNKIYKLDITETPKDILFFLAFYQGLNYHYLNDKETACNFFYLAILTGERSLLTTQKSQFILDNCEGK